MSDQLLSKYFPGFNETFCVPLDIILNVLSPYIRLTFWLSNSIVLRAIVSQAVKKLQLAAAPSINNNGGQKGWQESSPYEEEETNERESSDEWEKPQTYLAALEKVESWIFSRIVESVWWQVKS